MTLSLDGVTVVELSTSIAGPFAGQILGDLGADVIKVERPGSGDDTRTWGPPFWEGESAAFLAMNRNKRSVDLDLKDSRDLAAMKELLATADVFIQNMRPGSLEPLGLGYGELSARNPRLVVADMSGYGPGGPKGMEPAYDPLLQAWGGLMSLTGEIGGTPVRVPASILDQGTAMWTAIGVLDALIRREATGHGSHVETSLLATALQWLPGQFMGYFADGTVPKPAGSGNSVIAPYQAFAALDGHLIIAAGNNAIFERMCAALGLEELVADPRFADNPSRVTNRPELVGLITARTRTQTVAELCSLLAKHQVPATPIQTLDQVANDPHVQSIGVFIESPHPRIPGFRSIALPVKRDGSWPAVRLVPPLLGEHRHQLLDEVRESTEPNEVERP